MRIMSVPDVGPLMNACADDSSWHAVSWLWPALYYMLPCTPANLSYHTSHEAPQPLETAAPCMSVPDSSDRPLTDAWHTALCTPPRSDDGGDTELTLDMMKMHLQTALSALDAGEGSCPADLLQAEVQRTGPACAVLATLSSVSILDLASAAASSSCCGSCQQAASPGSAAPHLQVPPRRGSSSSSCSLIPP